MSERKADHLRIAAEPGIEHTGGSGLEAVRLRHRALPERDLADVSLRCELLGAALGAPLLISAMTGGTGPAGEVNARLAAAAAEHRIGLVLGSGRPLLDDPGLLATYRPPGGPRPPLLLANLGAAQVRGPGAPQRADRLVELLDADGLSIHLNPVQEAVQPEGEPVFSGVLEGIAAIVERLAPRPVVVKEVGFGIDGEDVRALAAAGVAAVDVAGAGGTNWALIEGRRDARAGAVAAAFAGWGVADRRCAGGRGRRGAGPPGDRFRRPPRRRRRGEVPRARRRRGGPRAAVPDRRAGRPGGRGGRHRDRPAPGCDVGRGRAVDGGAGLRAPALSPDAGGSFADRCG